MSILHRELRDTLDAAGEHYAWGYLGVLLSENFFSPGGRPDPRELVLLLRELNVPLPAVRTLLETTTAAGPGGREKISEIALAGT